MHYLWWRFFPWFGSSVNFIYSVNEEPTFTAFLLNTARSLPLWFNNEATKKHNITLFRKARFAWMRHPPCGRALMFSQNSCLTRSTRTWLWKAHSDLTTAAATPNGTWDVRFKLTGNFFQRNVPQGLSLIECSWPYVQPGVSPFCDLLDAQCSVFEFGVASKCFRELCRQQKLRLALTLPQWETTVLDLVTWLEILCAKGGIVDHNVSREHCDNLPTDTNLQIIHVKLVIFWRKNVKMEQEARNFGRTVFQGTEISISSSPLTFSDLSARACIILCWRMQQNRAIKSKSEIVWVTIATGSCVVAKLSVYSHHLTTERPLLDKY